MKHPKISDLFDTLQAPDLPLEPDSACSAERIKAATLAKIQASQGQSPRHPRRKYKTLILAAALTLALSVGALAANDLLPGHIFQSFFGTGLGSNAEGVVEYTDDGRLVTNLPAWERVEVDASLAEEVLTPYLTTTDETISYAGYTLALEANLYDPATGCGLASYTLENPDGVTGYQVLEDGELWFDNQTVFARTDQAGHLFLDSGRSSDTKLCILEYYIAAEPLKDLDLELGAFVPDPENGGVYGETQDTLSIPLKAAQLPLAQADQAGSLPAVTLSPIGLSLSLTPPAAGDRDRDALADTISYLALEYADGSRYVILDTVNFLDNSAYALCPSDSSSIYSFNRLVDTRQVVKVLVNGQEIPL